MTEKVTIYSPIFWEFCLKIQEAIQQGYVFSEENDNFPTAFVGSYNATLVKEKTEQQPSQKGRKATSKEV